VNVVKNDVPDLRFVIWEALLKSQYPNSKFQTNHNTQKQNSKLNGIDLV